MGALTGETMLPADMQVNVKIAGWTGFASQQRRIDMKKHITMFDRAYPKEKQAEGLAISQAIVNGKCEKCLFLKQCESDRNFQFPPSAWCGKRKQEILKGWS